jgi:uncharacterized protein (DUF58 family)
MLTARGWLFLFSVISCLTLALIVPPDGYMPLALVGLMLLLWFLFEWLVFACRLHLTVRQLTVEREVRDEHGEVANLWAGRTFEVRCRIAAPSWPGVPYLLATERIPFGVEQVSGENGWEGPITAAQPAEMVYRVRCPASGQVRFEGIALQVTDLQGFFYHRAFLPAVRVYRVLPVLTDVDTHLASTKRYNLLPPPGIHRHRRPGSGSELLDLRDYLPGDPPRMIAWKVSARRDRLITKEFESDVPVRCTLFVDTSHSVRLGPPGSNALARLVEIAAAVAQASAGNRDPVGLGLFDEQTVTYLRPARTRRHLSQILNLLGDAASLAPATSEATADALLPLAYSFAQEVYPHLLQAAVNAFPGWLAWLKPRSIWTVPRPTFGDFLYWLMPLLAVGVSGFVGYVFLRLWVALARWLASAPFTAQLIANLVLGLSALALVLLFFRLMLLLFPKKRRAYRWRKQLAAVLSVRYGLAPGGLAMLLEDDRQFAGCAQRFLVDHHVPVPVPLYDRHGQYLFASPGKIDVLAQLLLRAVGKGHDNEMFVLLVDLLELGDELAPLLRAVKVTLARHHQVIVVCPWPPGLEPPERQSAQPAPTERMADLARAPQPMERVVQDATTQRFHQAFYQVRRTFARLGVPVICAQGADPARLIVDRLDRLRTLRSSPHVPGLRT